jgi:hypothetical protein
VAHSVHHCPSCNVTNTAILEGSRVLICKNCGDIVLEKLHGNEKPQVSRVPADWSFVQLNTTGEYRQEIFKVVGRVRLQLRNDYKNFWCCSVSYGKTIWIMESFASFAVLDASWYSFDKDVRHLHAGESIQLKSDLKLKGDYVEKCEGVSYEGEIAGWKLFWPGFFVIQATNRKGQTAVFTVKAGDHIEYLTGETLEWEKLSLKNIVQLNEWK